MLALLGIAHHRPGGFVELKIAAARVVEGADRLAIGRREVVEERIEIGVDLPADRLAALAEMQGRGRRNGHLGSRAGARLQEAEMLDLRMAGEVELADDADAFRLGVDPGEMDAVLGLVHLDTLEAAVEIEMPPRAAELAVGGELQPDLL